MALFPGVMQKGFGLCTSFRNKPNPAYAGARGKYVHWNIDTQSVLHISSVQCWNYYLLFSFYSLRGKEFNECFYFELGNLTIPSAKGSCKVHTGRAQGIGISQVIKNYGPWFQICFRQSGLLVDPTFRTDVQYLEPGTEPAISLNPLC